MPHLADDFRPARGLRDGHAQTFFGAVARRARPPALRRERRETADGDFIDVDVLAGRPGTPTVLLLHGLEGSSASGAVRHMLAGLASLGWGAVALNFRGCSGEPNRFAASYSSGDFRDALEVLRSLPQPRAAVGFSLGGSVLLNLLAQRGDEAGLAAAAAVSVPFDLSACASGIDSGRGLARVYLRHFLPSMKQKALERARRFPGALDAARIRAADTIRGFDDLVTAPLFGFASAEAYYQRCSAGPQLAAITTPTLLLSAQDDPLAPARYLPGAAAAQPALDVLVTRHGGHVGYVEGSVLAPAFYAERAVLRWLDARLTA